MRDAYKRARPSHVTLIVQNQEGLKNLFKIVSASLVKYYYRTPRIPRSLLDEFREGLLIGTACDEGELFTAVMQRDQSEVEKLRTIMILSKFNHLHCIKIYLIES